jgi:eukaryotic-like serine/threonine-protein kinase
MVNDLIGKLIADKYLVEALVSESESGDLYTGRHEVLDKPVIIKVLAPALAVDGRWSRRFVEEARTASAVTHPNVLSITDFGTDARGVSYAIYEQHDGTTLAEALELSKPFDDSRALHIAKQVATGIAAAHAKQIIHGQLSPSYIYLVTDETGAETVKVFGFGGDRLRVARDADVRYLAPEQMTAFPAADERSDIFSLGVITFEMLSGVVPYEGGTVGEVQQKQQEPPPPLSAFSQNIHPEIEPILLTAMAIDAESRYATMDLFREDLELVASRTATPAVAASPLAHRKVWQTAAIAAAGMLLLGSALIYATWTKGTDPTQQLQADAGSLPVQPIGPATGAQEESLAKLPPLTDAELIAAGNMQQVPGGVLPGGDGYNAWANGGVPPPGAPPGATVMQPYMAPGGQVYTIDPNSGSQFMPTEGGGVILVPIPANTAPPANTATRPQGNTASQPAANTAAPTGTPTSTNSAARPMATPPPRNQRPAANTSQPARTPAAAKTPGGEPDQE